MSIQHGAAILHIAFGSCLWPQNPESFCISVSLHPSYLPTYRPTDLPTCQPTKLSPCRGVEATSPGPENHGKHTGQTCEDVPGVEPAGHKGFEDRLLGGKRRSFPRRSCWAPRKASRKCGPNSVQDVHAGHARRVQGDCVAPHLDAGAGTERVGSQPSHGNGRLQGTSIGTRRPGKGLFSTIDGANAARWAWILPEIGEEDDVMKYVDWFVAKARAHSDMVPAIQVYRAWTLAMALKNSTSFGEATRTHHERHGHMAGGGHSQCRAASQHPHDGPPNGSLEFYVIRDYMSRYDTGLAVTVRKANLGKRVPLKDTVKIKSIWNLIEAAAKSGTSLRQAVIVKKHDEGKDLHGPGLSLAASLAGAALPAVLVGVFGSSGHRSGALSAFDGMGTGPWNTWDLIGEPKAIISWQAKCMVIFMAAPPCQDFARIGDREGHDGNTGYLFNLTAQFIGELRDMIKPRRMGILAEKCGERRDDTCRRCGGFEPVDSTRLAAGGPRPLRPRRPQVRRRGGIVQDQVAVLYHAGGRREGPTTAEIDERESRDGCAAEVATGQPPSGAVAR
ncbi:unnamed protein product [Symbiodinium sp. KB8]|nr:unnamed protein product [Symbiodinium sp. KB8]